MLIGIAGTLGAGKGTVVDFLKEKGFVHYSVSGILKDVLNERGLPSTRTNLSALADELNEQYEGGVLHLANEIALRAGVEKYILESIHRPSEASYVRSLGGIIFGVDADVKIRYERSTKRKEGEKDDVTFEQFIEHVAREEEGKGKGTPNIRAVMNTADYIITNDGTLEELHAQVEEILKKLEV